MQNLIVVNNPEEWDLDVEGVQVVPAREYLTDPTYSKLRGVRVFNIARSYRYQRTGYYVSLLAAARGHRPLPDIETIQDLKSRSVVRLASDDVDELAQRCLAPLQSREFVLSVYFGHNMAQRHDRLAAALFQQFPAPFLRAQFERDEGDGRWELRNIDSIGVGDIPEAHRPYVRQVAHDYFAARSRRHVRRASSGYDLAILVNPEEAEPPSNERAIKRFVKAGEQVGLGVDVIGPDDLGRIAEYDALFLRETTAVNHRTFRAARRAEGLGLVVMDDPASILRCTNKVFLAEVMERNGVPAPRTLIVHKYNVDSIRSTIGLPAVLKQPDSSYSRGVVKVETPEELEEEVARLLGGSDLVVAQEYLPTEFDWRIGVLDGHPFYASRYFMAKDHWQIVKRDEKGEGEDWGVPETLPVEMAPTPIVKAAVKAAALIGDGLYGVDVKESGGKPFVIEVNDNPTIDAGFEDAVLKDELYLRIMRVFLERIRRRKEGSR